MPESVTDRVRRSHEQWFHLTREPRYFSAVDNVREPLLQPDRKRADVIGGRSADLGVRHDGPTVYTGPTSHLGRTPGSVWSIPTQPLTVPASLGVDHFAAFPMQLPRRIILGWSPSGVCMACGEGRRPVSEAEVTNDRGGRKFNVRDGNVGALGLERVYRVSGEACACTPRTLQRGQHGDWRKGREVMPERRSDDFGGSGGAVPRRPGGFGTRVPTSPGRWAYDLDGWEPPPTRPAVILDPFGGTGTTALLAHALGRVGVSVDLSHDYGRLARWRTTDPGELARALQVDKPPVEVDGQEDLFSDDRSG